MERNLITFKPKRIFFQPDNAYSRFQNKMYYAYMFLDDLGTSIIPLGGRRFSGKPFSITMAPFEEQQKARINLLFPSRFHQNRRLHSRVEETVSDFIKECADSLVIHRTLYYEIVPAEINHELVEGNINLQQPVFVLVSIPGRVVRFGQSFIQLIPKKHWKYENKKFVVLPVRSVWRISIPKKIGGKKSVEELLEGLFIAGGKYQAQAKILEEDIFEQTPFNFDSYYRKAEIFVAWLTKSWGWDIRFSLQRYTLEYYQVYRRIMSAYTMALFREHIFDEINSLLHKIGYGFQMKMVGLPASDDIYKLFGQLKNDEKTFTEITETININ